MAAKVIRVSDDAGSNWFNLPGATGSLSSDAEAADDTIFGQTFRSQEVGLIAWSVQANSYFRGFAGYNTDVKKQGTSTAMVAEATTLTVALTYQITDAAKRILDRGNTVTVKDDGVAVDAADIEWIDYLFGRVKFVSGYVVTGAITFDANYFPTTVLGRAQSFSITQSSEYIDDTDYATAQANGGYRTGDPGLRTVAVELTGIYDPTGDFAAALAARSELIIEIDPRGDGSSICRGFFKLASQGLDGSVGALEEETLTFNLTVPLIEAPDLWLPFAWVHTSSEIAQGLQKVLEAWQNETLIEVDYLPTGVRGETPLNGSNGNAVVTEASVSGGLSDVVTFDLTFQGSGAKTAV